MNSIIIESGMNLIADNIFHIEKSPLYKRLDNNIKSVEFIRAKNNKLIFVEAKSSFPNPNNPMSNIEKGSKNGAELFRAEIVDICDKFIHSLNLYAAVAVGATDDSFPFNYNPPDKASLQFILIIKSFEKSWCDEIEKALMNLMRNSVCISKIWKPEVFVINDEIATCHGIVSGSNSVNTRGVFK